MTRHLRKARTAADISDILENSRDRLAAQHLVAAIMRTSYLADVCLRKDERAIPLLDEVDLQLRPRVDELSGHDICRCIWAFKRLRYFPSLELLQALITELLRNDSAKIVYSQPTYLVQLASAVAFMRIEAPALWQSLMHVFTMKLDRQRPQVLTTFEPDDVVFLADTLASTRTADKQLMDRLAVEAVQHVDSLSVRQQGKLLEAYATSRMYSATLFQRCTTSLLTRTQELEAASIAAVAAALSLSDHYHAQLFEALVVAAAAQVDKFSPLELAKLVAALAMAKHPIDESVGKLLARLDQDKAALDDAGQEQLRIMFGADFERLLSEQVRK